MKKIVPIALTLVVLLLAACAPKTTSPQDKATFCASLQIFNKDFENLLSLGAGASNVELKAAYSTAAASFHNVQLAGKNMSEPAVKAFLDAASGLNTALGYYVANPNPDPASKASALASLKQQGDLFKSSYQNLTKTVCPAP